MSYAEVLYARRFGEVDLLVTRAEHEQERLRLAIVWQINNGITFGMSRNYEKEREAIGLFLEGATEVLEPEGFGVAEAAFVAIFLRTVMEQGKVGIGRVDPICPYRWI